MGFWNALFGGKELSPEDEKKLQEAKKFDLMKYDGVKAMKIGQAGYAVRCFREALKLKEDLELHDYLSQALIRVGELGEAIDELKVLAEAEPTNPSIQLRIAQVAYMQEDYAMMKEASQLAIQLDETNAQARYLNAEACLGQGNIVGAVAMLTKAISLKADYADAYLLRAQTLLKMGEAEVADADAAWLIHNVGAHEDVLLLKARIETAKGNAEQAIKVYDLVTEVNPFAIDAFRERGKLKFDAGDKEGAEADMQKVLELDPNALADVNGDYSAEGIEQRVKQAYSAVNPLGL
jgi:tetratricopeptide (TPR) repeat protein